MSPISSRTSFPEHPRGHWSPEYVISNMAPVPVYSASPINASKASGPSPQTAKPDGTSTTTAPASVTTSATSTDQYAPQPGSGPSLPVQTGAPQSLSSTYSVQPTPTQPLPSQSGGPPAPQPGAGIPPPPKAGETLQTSHQPAAPRTSYPAPEPSPYPASAPSGAPVGAGDTYSHPPGYHQNDTNFHSMHDQGPVDEDDDSVWGTAKKWATAAGNSLAEAENEVWRRFTK